MLETAALAKENNLKCVMITNGFINEKPLKELLPYIDAMNIDLKSFNNEFYKEIVGGDIEDVKNSIKIASRSCHVEVTNLIIPGFNDSKEEIREMAEFLSEIDENMVLHISKFFPRHKFSDIPETSEKTLYEMAFEAQKHLKNVVLGNI